MAKKSPFKAFDPGTAILISTGVQALMGGIGGKRQEKAVNQANRMAAEQQAAALAFQKEQAALLEQQKEVYRQMEFVNPYEGMENVYEDLTVSQEAARFQAEQGAQQRANILDRLRGAAGGSGIANLAQSLAGQGVIQARQISADIARQEAANQQLAAQGASAVDMAFRGGEAMVQEAEMSRQSTLLGMAYGGSAGANQAVQQAYANQMQASLAQSQMYGQQMQMWGQIGSNLVQALPHLT